MYICQPTISQNARCQELSFQPDFSQSRNIKYKSKRLWSALDKAEGLNGATDTVTAYEFASALTGLGRAELEKRVDGRNADAGTEAYLFN